MDEYIESSVYEKMRKKASGEETVRDMLKKLKGDSLRLK
jgi:hypothetical protein